MRPDDDINDFAHLPQVDEAKIAKQDLWRLAKEAAEARRAAQSPAPVPEQAAPRTPVPSAPAPASVAPKRKIKVKLRVPPGARAAQEQEPEPEPFESNPEPVSAEESWPQPEEEESWSQPEDVYEEPAALLDSPQPAVEDLAAPEEPAREPVIEKTPQEPVPLVSARKLPASPASPPADAEVSVSRATDAAVAVKSPPEKGKLRLGAKKAKPASQSEPARPDSKADSAAASTPPEAHAPGVVVILSPEEEEAERKTRMKRFWEKIGGRSLALSIIIHLTLFTIAGFIYFSYSETQRIDFLPGGGTQQGEQASQALEKQITRKKTRWLNKKLPMQRIAVEKSMSDISLPDATPELLDLPMTKDFMSAGKMGSLGFGTSGAGGGFGNGIGVGGKSGVTFTPLSMFGKKIVGRRIAVVMDVSRSMTPYLEAVVKELDRVASGSPVILYYGCGLLRPGNEKIDETTQRTQAKDFERFWRVWQGNAMLGFSGVDLKKVTFPRGEKIPLEDLYRFFARRNNTWYLDYNGMDYAWTALLCQEIRNADALYWFSDFEDNVDEKQLKVVLDNVLVRRQRLYIHPQVHGASFEQVVSLLVKPSGGEVVEPDDKKKGKK